MMKNREYEVVEDHPHLIRDTYSKAITNRDVDAYNTYMSVNSEKKRKTYTIREPRRRNK